MASTPGAVLTDTHTWQAPLPPGRIGTGRVNLSRLLNVNCLMFSDNPPCCPRCRQYLSPPSPCSSHSLLSGCCVDFSSWLSSLSSSRPGSAGRGSAFPSPPKARDGLLEAEPGFLAAEQCSLSTRGWTQSGGRRAEGPANLPWLQGWSPGSLRGWEAAICLRSAGIHAAFRPGLQQLTLGSAPTRGSGAALFAYLVP